MKKNIILLILILLFSLSLIYQNRDYSYDSIEYSIEAGPRNLSFHPHHLLFYPTIKSVDFLFAALNIQAISEVMPIQFMNIIIFPFAVFLFYLIIIKVTDDSKISVIIFLIFAFSGGLWTLSVDNEVHTLPVFFILFALYLFLRGFSLYTVSFVFTLSVLYHQSYILALPAFAYLFYSFPQGKKSFRTFLFSFTSLSLTAVFYFLAAITEGKGSIGEIIKWILFYTESGKWGNISFNNFFYSGAGLFQLFFAPRFMRAVVFGKAIEGIDYFYVLLEVLGVFFITVTSVMIFMKMIKEQLFRDKWIRFSTIFLLPFSSFAFFWEPHNVEFWIPVFIPLLIMTARISSSNENDLSVETLSAKRTSMRHLPALLIFIFLTMFIHNLFSAIIPASNIQNNETYLFAEKLSPYISDGDLLIHNKKRPLSYLKYFFNIEPDYTSFAEYPLKKWKKTDEIKEIISELIDKHLKNGKKVIITSSEINPPEYDPAMTGVINAKERSDFYKRYELMFDNNLIIIFDKNCYY